MALRSVVETGSGFVQKPPELVAVDGKLTPVSINELNRYLIKLTERVNGGLLLGDGTVSGRAGNLSGQFLQVTFTTADTTTTIPHGLNRIPIGYLVVGRNKACVVYDSSIDSLGGVEAIFLKCNTANSIVNLIVF